MRNQRNALGLIISIMFVVFAAGCSQQPSASSTTEEEEPSTPVMVENVEGGSLDVKKEIVGNLVPETQANVTPKVQGELVSLNVKKGDTVQKGDVLGKIDDESLREQVELRQIGLQQAQAQLEQAKLSRQTAQNGLKSAQNQLEQANISIEQGKKGYDTGMTDSDLNVDNARIQWEDAKENVEKLANLYREGAIPYQDYQAAIDGEKQARIALEQAQLAAENSENTEDIQMLESQKKAAEIGIADAKENIKNAENSVQQAQNGVQQAQTELEQARSQLNDPVLYAPLTGEVTSISNKVGEMVSSANPFATIVSLTPATVRAQVSSEQLSLFTKGETVDVIIPSIDETREATVSYVAAASEDNGLFTVEVTLPNEDKVLKPGMVTKIAVTTSVVDNALLVPTEAVVEANDEAMIYVVENDRAVQKDVEIVEMQSDVTAVSGDFSAGDTVIVKGQGTLNDGSLVRIMEGDE
ncbi:efflux RND transporter periplasmic adaptor subunit [Bacillaceae bacterium SIJ1]|uniref:efflux RND transporter periplasmic adaptor subunit n=1 Tax=Litoribacterium kuwaitense TaxID=1398745 RepID=UPI0013EC116C|nr:efflux RND transporter periplasmic adaptor subunit [Litoribacterium kuwaitense]NGP43948.1 efflux RND transporter periplasmic adaptor subunit [Litoribacterium kuwaitense]